MRPRLHKRPSPESGNCRGSNRVGQNPRSPWQCVRSVLSSYLIFVVNAGIWPASVALADDPVAAVWQLAGIAPVSALDHVALLRSTTAEGLLDRTATLAAEAAALAQFSTGPDGDRQDGDRPDA